jgi:hypothetical protein
MMNGWATLIFPDTSNRAARCETSFMKQLSPSPEAAAAILRVPLAQARARLASHFGNKRRPYVPGPLWSAPNLGRKR